jgi:hypothetical protein
MKTEHRLLSGRRVDRVLCCCLTPSVRDIRHQLNQMDSSLVVSLTNPGLRDIVSGPERPSIERARCAHDLADQDNCPGDVGAYRSPEVSFARKRREKNPACSAPGAGRYRTISNCVAYESDGLRRDQVRALRELERFARRLGSIHASQRGKNFTGTLATLVEDADREGLFI